MTLSPELEKWKKDLMRKVSEGLKKGNIRNQILPINVAISRIESIIEKGIEELLEMEKIK